MTATEAAERNAQQATWELEGAAILAYRAALRALCQAQPRGRARLVQTLLRTAELFEALDGTGELAPDFSDLALALLDLNGGIVHPLIQPAPLAGGRTQDRSDVWEARAQAAIAIEYLHAGGMEWTAAERYAAKRFPGLARLFRRGALDLQSSLRNWRNRLGADEVRNASAKQSFKDGLCILAEFKAIWPAPELQKLGDRLLARAEARAKEIEPNC